MFCNVPLPKIIEDMCSGNFLEFLSTDDLGKLSSKINREILRRLGAEVAAYKPGDCHCGTCGHKWNDIETPSENCPKCGTSEFLTEEQIRAETVDLGSDTPTEHDSTDAIIKSVGTETWQCETCGFFGTETEFIDVGMRLECPKCKRETDIIQTDRPLIPTMSRE